MASKNQLRCVGVSQFDVAGEIGAVRVCESDAKLTEEVFEFSNCARREYEEVLHYDAISGMHLSQDLNAVENAWKMLRERLDAFLPSHLDDRIVFFFS